ncbi:MAG TPA: hypothetical protein VFD96_01355, partial [Burkholderiaceae bacterium]|nr:hypothetical protein [Burkholderiaceae bacterium]
MFSGADEAGFNGGGHVRVLCQVELGVEQAERRAVFGGAELDEVVVGSDNAVADRYGHIGMGG